MQRGAIVWGSLLILVGGLLLLDRLGIIVVDNWLMFWPLILIGVGFSFLFGERNDEEPRPLATEHLVMELKGAESAEIHFKFDGGNLTVNAEAPPDQLLAGSFDGGVTYQARDLGDDRVLLTMLTPADNTESRIGRAWLISLNADLPLALKLESGESEITLDLETMQVVELDLQIGTSHADITLPSTAGFTRVEIEGTAPTIMLHIPQDVAASIDCTAANGHVDVDRERFPQTGSSFQSPEYPTAANRIEIVAALEAGSITFR